MPTQQRYREIAGLVKTWLDGADPQDDEEILDDLENDRTPQAVLIGVIERLLDERADLAAEVSGLRADLADLQRRHDIAMQSSWHAHERVAELERQLGIHGIPRGKVPTITITESGPLPSSLTRPVRSLGARCEAQGHPLVAYDYRANETRCVCGAMTVVGNQLSTASGDATAPAPTIPA